MLTQTQQELITKITNEFMSINVKPSENIGLVLDIDGIKAESNEFNDFILNAKMQKEIWLKVARDTRDRDIETVKRNLAPLGYTVASKDLSDEFLIVAGIVFVDIKGYKQQLSIQSIRYVVDYNHTNKHSVKTAYRVRICDADNYYDTIEKALVGQQAKIKKDYKGLHKIN